MLFISIVKREFGKLTVKIQSAGPNWQLYKTSVIKPGFKNTLRPNKPFPTVKNALPVKKTVNFKGNPIVEIKNAAKFLYAKKKVSDLKKYIDATDGKDSFVLRQFAMEPFEGLQYGIKAFKGMTMKEIQYLCENLHVIAVNRGCKNMCGYCYADAKPSKRAMSWEDFTTITKGLKTLRKRFSGLDIFGENFQISKEDLLYRTTELFYDADCMSLAVKDKKGKLYDFTELATELYNSTGRRTAFDTSGWYKNNPIIFPTPKT